MYVLLQLAIEHPKIGGVFGLIMAALFAAGGVATMRDLQSMPEQPEQLPLATIAGRLDDSNKLWASTTDNIKWDCQSIAYRKVGNDTRTEVMFTDERESVIGVAEYSDQRSCDEIVKMPVSGFFYKMSEYHRSVLIKEGFDLVGYSNATTFLDVCTFCSRSNSTLGVIAGVIFVPLGLAMYPLCLQAKRHRENRRRKLSGKAHYPVYSGLSAAKPIQAQVQQKARVAATTSASLSAWSYSTYGRF